MTWWPRLGVLHRDRLLAYLAVAVAAFAFVGCGAAAGGLAVIGVAAVVLGMVAVVVDGSAGAAALLLTALIFDWVISVPVAETWWTLPAVAALILAWSGSALAGSGPHEARLSPALVRAWLIRTAIVVLGCLAVGAAALSLVGIGQIDTPLIAALALLATAAAVVGLSVRWFGSR